MLFQEIFFFMLRAFFKITVLSVKDGADPNARLPVGREGARQLRGLLDHDRGRRLRDHPSPRVLPAQEEILRGRTRHQVLCPGVRTAAAAVLHPCGERQMDC